MSDFDFQIRLSKHGERIKALETLFPQMSDAIKDIHLDIKELANEVRSTGAINSQLLETGDRIASSLEAKVEQDKNSGKGVLSAFLYGMAGWHKFIITVMFLVILGVNSGISPDTWSGLISKGS